MDLITIAIIVVGGLVAIGLAAWMLNRAWGDFPSRAGPPEQGTSPLPPPPALRGFSEQPEAPRNAAEGDESAEPGAADFPPGAPEADLIPITNDLVRRAAQQALERGGSPYATYFIRHGDQIFLAAHRIADPVQRAQVVRVFTAIDSGGAQDLNFAEIIGVLRQLGK